MENIYIHCMFVKTRYLKKTRSQSLVLYAPPDEIMAILVLLDHFWILSAFSKATSFFKKKRKKWDPIKSMRTYRRARPRGCTALVRSGAQYNNKTMWYHCGAHSCSSFADLVIKNIQWFKAKLALNRWIFFMTRSAKLECPWFSPAQRYSTYVPARLPIFVQKVIK